MGADFYGQLGVASHADINDIRVAYVRAVSQTTLRRKLALEHRGDTAAFDLLLAQLDESWRVLSDPVRRRRYDAMLDVVDDNLEKIPEQTLWERVSGAMIHPDVVVAARLVNASTSLCLGDLPESAPVSHAAESPVNAADLGVTDLESEQDTEPSAQADALVHDLTTPTGVADAAGDLAWFEPEPYETPAPAGPSPEVLAMETSQLVASYGYSGDLLRILREQRGLTYAELSDSLGLSEAYLVALEREDLANLPQGRSYQLGYLRNIADFYQLDRTKFVEGYLHKAQRRQG